MKNLNFLFHREYYDELTEEHFARCNSQFYQADFTKENHQEAKRQLCGNSSFVLKTIYPGLLLGHSMVHNEIKKSEECMKAGFIFDYVTGMPYISGSMVKGVVRAAFSHPEMIKELLERDDVCISDLEKELFGEANRRRTKKTTDVFFDAKLIRGNRQGKFLAPELRASGKGPLQNFGLQKHLKIRAGVLFEFDFDFKDGVISAAEKTELVKRILILMGVGARTGVGYGALKASKKPGFKAPLKQHLLDEVRDSFLPDKTQTEEYQNLDQKLSQYRMGPQKNTFVLCECGAKNIKLNYISRTVNSSWKKAICFRCGADLKERIKEAEADYEPTEE